MTKPPEGVTTVTAEGIDVESAVAAAARELGVPFAAVEWTLDLTHFRSAEGSSRARDTVKVVAWARDAEEVDAARDAQEWMATFLRLMDFPAQVQAGVGSHGHVEIRVDAGENGRHLVGRRGTTLRSVQALLDLCVGTDYPDRTFRLDVADARRGEGGDAPRGDRRDGDRRDGDRRDGDRRDGDRRDGDRRDGDRRDGPRRDGGPPRGDRREGDAPRGDRREGDAPRGDRRGRDRDDRRGRDQGGERRGRDDRRGRDQGGDRDDDKLRAFALKIAQRVARTGEPEIIRRELNAYDRRIVHVVVAEVGGLISRSLGDGVQKQIEIAVDPEARAQGGGEE